MISIGLLGSRGRMGQWVSRLLASDYSAQANLAAEGGRDSLLAPLLKTDAVIDFSLPEAFVPLAEQALASSGPLPVFVVGSTGWKPDSLRVVEELARRTPVVMSSNFSIGVLALQHVLKQHSALLTQLGYTPVMMEAHHRHKKDAPSGTALMLNRTIQAASGLSEIQTHAVRSGEVIGDHEVTFYGPADHLVFGHFAQDRSIFARGAIDAALWLHRSRQALAAQQRILSLELYFNELGKSASTPETA